jgi:hypothetical protein
MRDGPNKPGHDEAKGRRHPRPCAGHPDQEGTESLSEIAGTQTSLRSLRKLDCGPAITVSRSVAPLNAPCDF